jgi:multisubunit Na+/H+ antiporter MnhC subunit
MKLITAHRILICAAIAFFAFFALVQTRRYVRAPAAEPLVEALVSAAVVVGLVVYYRTLRHWGRR